MECEAGPFNKTWTPTKGFSEMSSFRCKLSWKPPQANASLEFFLSQIDRELFEIPKKCLGYSNFSKEEWEYGNVSSHLLMIEAFSQKSR